MTRSALPSPGRSAAARVTRTSSGRSGGRLLLALGEDPPDPPARSRPLAVSNAYGPVPRKEDARFVRGKGTFIDDIVLRGMLHGAILRSPMAHARIVSIDT